MDSKTNGLGKEKKVSKDLAVMGHDVLPVNKYAVEELKAQRALLSDFVKSQLRPAMFDEASKKAGSYGEGDYGVIPGTMKRSLFKQGAEKLNRLFGLGVRFKQTDKEIDRHANFALYTYQAEIYVIRSGAVLAQCEGTANSQEIKYKEKTAWKKNKNNVSESSKIEVQIYDILNTLQKMAQKRAYVGCTLLATGASEYFTQDMLEEDFTPEEKSKAKAAAKAAGVGQFEDLEIKEVKEIEPPLCCGKKMMLSKYVDNQTGERPWYCLTCKKPKPVEVAQ